MSYTRRQRRDSDDFLLWKLGAGLLALYGLYMVGLWYTNRIAYWEHLGYLTVLLVLILVGEVVWVNLRAKWRREKMEKLLAAVRSAGLEEYLNNFISQFGMNAKKGKVWTYRTYAFDWDRMRDLRKFLIEKGLPLRNDDWSDLSLLLRHYIQEREERYTRESISTGQGDAFANLSGSDFEKLLYRLFAAMGYSVQKTGKVGDQGADLVVNMNNQRTVVQAKCYTNNVGNAAVQEATAAQKFYDCTRAMVITTSGFTKEAWDLAKANRVDLLGGDRLKQLILQYLKESWS